MHSPCISIIGTSHPQPSDLKAAKKVASMCATHGITVLCGGTGSKEFADHVARGTRQQGGNCIGLLPQPCWTDSMPPFSTILQTGMGSAADYALISSADVLLAIGQDMKTLSALALVVDRGIPVVSLDGWKDLAGVEHAQDGDDAFWRCFAALGLGVKRPLLSEQPG